MRNMIAGACLTLCGVAAGLLIPFGRAGASDGLMGAYATIERHKFVDLTHAFAPGVAHWPGFPDETVRTLFTIPKDGFLAQMFCHVGQWGTHVDAPAHFAIGGKTVDEIDPKQMLLPLVVIDVHANV
ncbi:MAG: cyclase family protein, partial [Candidatus Eremiobacteraeota bacterium]|nr:cyclase family protein [Candidatus Eremiobacteraeota bacterium]